ncbi:MAG: hypothetical protein AB2813_14230 [Candidatus Sedimenticola endophacoides]
MINRYSSPYPNYIHQLFVTPSKHLYVLKDRRLKWQDKAMEVQLDKQVCRYLVKDFGTSQSPKSTRQRDSRYCPDRPALITTPSRTLQQSCSCATPS